MELLVVGILFFIFNIFLKTSKSGGGVVEKAGMQLSNDTDKNTYNQLVNVSCPNCKASLYISESGDWECEKCNKVFVYYKNVVYKQEDIHSILAIYIMTILSKFCKIDGRVIKRELEIVEENLNSFLGTTHKEMNGLKKIFNIEMKNVDNYGVIIEKLYENLKGSIADIQSTGLFLIETMLQIGMCDEEGQGLNPRHHEMIAKTIGIFNFDINLFEDLKNKYIGNNVDHYYEVLQCDKNATMEEIKRKYRELSKKYHPDLLSSKDLPPEVIELTSNKFREINEAYNILINKIKL